MIPARSRSDTTDARALRVFAFAGSRCARRPALPSSNHLAACSLAGGHRRGQWAGRRAPGGRGLDLRGPRRALVRHLRLRLVVPNHDRRVERPVRCAPPREREHKSAQVSTSPRGRGADGRREGGSTHTASRSMCVVTTPGGCADAAPRRGDLSWSSRESSAREDAMTLYVQVRVVSCEHLADLGDGCPRT